MGKKPRISEKVDVYMLVDLDLRICRYLHRHGITTIGQLVAAGPDEVSKIRGIGKKSLSDIGKVLDFYEVVADDNCVRGLMVWL